MAQDLTTESASSREYLINRGHSGATADIIEKRKSQMRGDPPQEKETIWISAPFRALRKFGTYLDPGLEDNSFMNHDIKFTPRYDDL